MASSILIKCPSCKETLPEDDFSICSSRKNGRQGYCKRCVSSRNKEYREANPDYNTSYHRQRRYDLSPEEFDLLRLNQSYCCAICGIDEDDIEKSFHVDHDHLTGKVRGLLCFDCNTGLGKFKDSIEHLEAAVAYLRTHNEFDLN